MCVNWVFVLRDENGQKHQFHIEQFFSAPPSRTHTHNLAEGVTGEKKCSLNCRCTDHCICLFAYKLHKTNWTRKKMLKEKKNARLKACEFSLATAALRSCVFTTNYTNNKWAELRSASLSFRKSKQENMRKHLRKNVRRVFALDVLTSPPPASLLPSSSVPV